MIYMLGCVEGVGVLVVRLGASILATDLCSVFILFAPASIFRTYMIHQMMRFHSVVGCSDSVSSSGSVPATVVIELLPGLAGDIYISQPRHFCDSLSSDIFLNH